jgi:hypothetical protein
MLVAWNLPKREGELNTEAGGAVTSDLELRVHDRDELAHVEAFVAQATVERLDERVLDRVAWTNEVELDAALIRPVFQRP